MNLSLRGEVWIRGSWIGASPTCAIIFGALVLSSVAALAEGKLKNSPAALSTSEYHNRELRGWKLYVHPSLSAEHAEIGKRVLAHLDHQLSAINERVPKTAVEKLRKTSDLG